MAYTATPLSKELIAGTANYRVIVGFTSPTPATEPTFQKELIITPEMTIQQGREWVWRQINEARPKTTVADLVIVGTPVVPLAPTAAPALTAAQVWREKAQRLASWKRLQALGFTHVATDAAIATLLADVNATAQASYVATSV